MDVSAFELPLLLSGACVAGIISAICGFGGGILYLPIVVAIVGPRTAVPLITLGLIFSNLSRVLLLFKHVKWPLTFKYCLGAIPGAILGALIFVRLPTGLLTRSIGVFLIASVFLRRFEQMQVRPSQHWIFIPLGAIVGFFSAIWGAIGPAAVPFFLATGLTKEAFVATIAFGAFAMHIAKTLSYGGLGLLHQSMLPLGAAIAVLMIFGTWIGHRILKRTTPRVFLTLVDGLLIVLGLFFLLK
ncbi:MAG TPA: sulfite exporter TauE/SafE family protein [candidate division Zixibacteria bacterium]|jgi:uncharacterized membrane protein YfcA